MNDELKAVRNLGTELGAVKAENDRLREQVKVLQSDANSWQSGYDKGRHDGARHRKSEVQQLRGLLRQATELIKEQDARLDVDMLPAGRALMKDIRAALSQQAEPVCPFCGEPSDHCNQSFPHPSKPAPAQDEQQPEQSKPANKLRALAEIWDQNADEADEFGNAQAAEALRLAAFELRAALSAQGAAKFRMGDLVKKSTGSEWEGRVVGTYSTEQTPEGYAVESSAHRNSVQIYPVTALEAVE